MPCRELRFVLSVVFYVVNEDPQNCIGSKSCRNQKKTPEIRRFQVFFGAADQIRTGDLILTNGTKSKLRHIVSSIIVFPFTTQITYPLATFYKWHYFFALFVKLVYFS